MPDLITKRWLPGESAPVDGRTAPCRRRLLAGCWTTTSRSLSRKQSRWRWTATSPALKLCLERLEPPRRRPRTVAHPEVEALLDGSADLDAIGLAVKKAVHRNELDPDDAYSTVEMLLARKRLAAKSAGAVARVPRRSCRRSCACWPRWSATRSCPSRTAASVNGSGNGAGR